MRIWVEINEEASQNKWGLKPRTNWGVAQNDLQLHWLKTHGFNEYKALVPQRDWAGSGKKEEKVKKREKAQEVFLWSWWPVSCPFFPLFIRNLCFWKDCFEGSFGWCSFRHLVTLLLEHPRLLTFWGHGRCSVKSNRAQFWALLRANYGAGSSTTTTVPNWLSAQPTEPPQSGDDDHSLCDLWICEFVISEFVIKNWTLCSGYSADHLVQDWQLFHKTVTRTSRAQLNFKRILSPRLL